MPGLVVAAEAPIAPVLAIDAPGAAAVAPIAPVLAIEAPGAAVPEAAVMGVVAGLAAIGAAGSTRRDAAPVEGGSAALGRAPWAAYALGRGLDIV